MSAAGGPCIGILGGGQLGRMLALAGIPLGLRFRFLAEQADVPAAACGEIVVGAADDPTALARFAEGLAAATWEFENVPVAAARWLAERLPVAPPPALLDAASDRLAEKRMLRDLDIATAPFACAGDDERGLARAIDEVGLPAVVKTRRGGYDGKGQVVVRETRDLPRAASVRGPRIAEALVDFDRELSVIAVRDAGGAVHAFPIAENEHDGGILRTSRAPAQGAPDAAAIDIATRILGAAYVGVLAVELFDVGGALLVNEIAPRVHNSGHWTQDGCTISQFESHVRAVAGLPIAAPRLRDEAAAMVNLIGELPPLDDLLGIDGARVHLYGKPPRPGRKLGHVNLSGDRDDVERGIDQVLRLAPRAAPA